MANAQVEKLKALGLRHGEKAVVGLASLICLILLVLAVSKKTIQITPDEVDKDAKAAQSNLNNHQDQDDILKTLEEQGVKEAGFEKLVDSQSKVALNPNDYKIAQLWVTPEPGAGLIRDTPKLLAPTELVAYPGRGGALIFELDKDGKRILEDLEKKAEDEATKARRAGKRNRSRGMMGGYGMAMGMAMPGMGGFEGGPGGEEAAKKEAARRQAELKRLLAGKDKPASDKTKEKAKTKEGETPVEEMVPEETGPFKEITKGLRWVAITGVLDHKTIRDNYLAALKNPAVAHPNYKELGVQRQALQSDGTWGDWEDVDVEKNRSIVFNLPETEEELAAEDTILDNLVAPLPFLKAGLWEKVHVVSLVPKEKKEVPKPGAGGMFGGMGGPGMYGGMSRGGMPGMAGGGMPGMMSGGGMPGMGAMMGAEGGYGGRAGMGMGMGMPGMGMPGMGGSEENTNFQKTEAETVMVRSLDFTVDPDTTYRFRVRVVVFNPNYNQDAVSPGVDNKNLELFGPWSEPTSPVTMPADVTPYTVQKSPVDGTMKRTDRVKFQVARWDPIDGVTVVRNFDAGPGEVVGDPATALIPTSEGTGAKNKTIDFNSHLLVVDTAGGLKPIAPVGAPGGPLDMPALSLMLRPDGSVVARSQTSDLPDTVRKDIDQNYKEEVKNSTKKRENSFGAGMGGYGMGMGGGMPGMGGGGRRGGGGR